MRSATASEGRAEEPVVAEKPLRGERVAFTGRLASMDRRQAWSLVVEAGGDLASAVSGRTTLLVVGSRGWPLLADGSISRKLARAEELRRQGISIRIESETDFLQRIGLHPEPRSQEPPVCSIGQAARMLGVEEGTIRLCCQFGLVRSRPDGLNFPDLVSLRTLISFFREGISPAAVARGLERLRLLLPRADRPLAQVRLIAGDGGTLLAQLQGARMELTGQLLLDFSAPPAPKPGRAARLVRPAAAAADPPALFGAALHLEAEGKPAEAEHFYRRALELDPLLPEAHFNLANLLLVSGDAAAAEAHYRKAVDIDPELACAWYNLGYALAEQDCLEEAAEAFCRALDLVPTSAEAHFSLALCYEDLGRRREAVRHWFAYLRLEPRGEWAEIARRHLSP